MTDAPRILALDAATHVGWAYGEAGKPPTSGSFKCAAVGSSRGAIFSGAGRWITQFIQANPIDILAIEAPLPGSHVQGSTNIQTATILQGLPAVFEFMAYQFRIYRLERVLLTSVRKHFIGKGNLKGDEAKPAVWRKCQALGWITAADEDLSHDRTDALAVWSYAEANFASSLTQPVDDLFVKSAQRKREAVAREAAQPAVERF